MNEGFDYNVTCHADASPNQVTYTWEREGKYISSMQTLHIKNVSRSDQGKYECSGDSVAGKKTTFTLLEIKCK